MWSAWKLCCFEQGHVASLRLRLLGQSHCNIWAQHWLPSGTILWLIKGYQHTNQGIIRNEHAKCIFFPPFSNLGASTQIYIFLLFSLFYSYKIRDLTWAIQFDHTVLEKAYYLSLLDFTDLMGLIYTIKIHWWGEVEFLGSSSPSRWDDFKT